MKNLYYTCLVILICASCFAQAPGYMGKRFVAGYGFYFSPALFGSNGQGSSILGHSNGHAETGTLAFNSLHEGYVEYALTRKFMLGFSARIYKSSYDNAIETSLNYNYTDPYGYQENYSTTVAPQGLYYIKGVNYSLYGKLYFGKYIAPWGRYFVFGPSLKTYSCTYSPNEMRIKLEDQYYGQPTQYYSNFGPTKQTFTRFDILAGFGRNRIVANRISIDYGFNVQVIALALTLFDATGVFTDNNVTPANYIQKTAPERVRGVNRFNAFLKVGVLLF